MHVCIKEGRHSCYSTHTGVKDVPALVLSFHCVDPRGSIQAVRLATAAFAHPLIRPTKLFCCCCWVLVNGRKKEKRSFIHCGWEEGPRRDLMSLVSWF